jgi:hypothetical protein
VPSARLAWIVIEAQISLVYARAHHAAELLQAAHELEGALVADAALALAEIAQIFRAIEQMALELSAQRARRLAAADHDEVQNGRGVERREIARSGHASHGDLRAFYTGHESTIGRSRLNCKRERFLWGVR